MQQPRNDGIHLNDFLPGLYGPIHFSWIHFSWIFVAPEWRQETRGLERVLLLEIAHCFSVWTWEWWCHLNGLSNRVFPPDCRSMFDNVSASGINSFWDLGGWKHFRFYKNKNSKSSQIFRFLRQNFPMTFLVIDSKNVVLCPNEKNVTCTVYSL